MGVMGVTVHPHVRGEGDVIDLYLPDDIGSPPRAWGRLMVTFLQHQPRRFTSTCVGKAEKISEVVLRNAVHPHVRGEGLSTRSIWGRPSGSPPRAWGRRIGSRSYRLAGRFTPTCVGKAAGRRSAGTPPAVHPHVRGEGAVGGSATAGGSRFTPTCVGKAAQYRAALRGTSGSPPRAWGRLLVGLAEGRRPRFTPTCVGKAKHEAKKAEGEAVHPHVRGEGG